MKPNRQSRKTRSRVLAVAVITGLASGAARMAIGWLLGHFTAD